MSNTEIYGVKSTGEVVLVGEASNAFRGAMNVWHNLSEKYNIPGGMFGGFQDLWKLADTGKLEVFENIAMKSTFDNVVVKKDDIPVLLESFREYENHFPSSSLPEQAEIIEREILNNSEMIGVCWNQTSVNENPWTDGYDEKNEEDIPYNVLTGKRHWFLHD